MKKEIILITGIISCAIGLIMLFYIAFNVTRPKAVDIIPYEYHFTVDGTDSLNLYNIYSPDGALIVEGIPASLIDSAINADNE